MVGDPWSTHPKAPQLEILETPFYSERGQENRCLAYCLQMAIEYVSESFPDTWVQDRMTTLEIKDICSELLIGEAGWRPKKDESDFDNISGKAGPIHFEHILRDQSPTRETFIRIIKKHLSRNLPVIPIINARLLRRSRAAGLHAVLVIGMSKDKIAFHDPWGYPKDIQPMDEFIDSWDDVLNQFVTIDLGGQQTLGEDKGRGNKE